MSSASAKTHNRIRKILEGCEGVVQIKDDMSVHGGGEKHNENLCKVFAKLDEHNITLNRGKCRLGMP